MKRFTLILLGLLLSLACLAQDALLERLKAANTFGTLQADFVQTRHSQMLTKDLVSEGRVALVAPDKLRWEVVKPYRNVFVTEGEGDSFASLGMTKGTSGMTQGTSGMTGKGNRRFRIPTDKDFSATVLEGEDVVVKLVPLRRDMKQMFREIIVHADKKSLRIHTALLVTPEGDWTQLEFKNILTGQSIDPKLFEKE
ncbi:MAG: outer membrane lipoprotein carrier protein LolA [Bacteroidales bacterium]|nr:outer membrane lipoprotein carrier protein LolA [Bacteroidales bacterium]